MNTPGDGVFFVGVPGKAHLYPVKVRSRVVISKPPRPGTVLLDSLCQKEESMRNIPADFWKHTLAKCALQLSVPPYTPIFVGLDTVLQAATVAAP